MEQIFSINIASSIASLVLISIIELLVVVENQRLIPVGEEAKR